MTQKRGKIHRKWLQMCPNGKRSYPTNTTSNSNVLNAFWF